MRRFLLAFCAAAAPAAALEAERAGAERGFAAAQGLVITPFAVRHRPTPAAPTPPQVCSGLDFKGVTWPPSMTHEDELALELALNISGSYEGAEGWANLTGNFDGQGRSEERRVGKECRL